MGSQEAPDIHCKIPLSTVSVMSTNQNLVCKRHLSSAHYGNFHTVSVFVILLSYSNYMFRGIKMHFTEDPPQTYSPEAVYNPTIQIEAVSRGMHALANNVSLFDEIHNEVLDIVSAMRELIVSESDSRDSVRFP